MADNIKADHIANVHDMVVDNTQSGSDINVTRKDIPTEVETYSIKGVQADLDEILAHFRNGTINPDPRRWAMDEADLHHAKQALLDWHNKQVLKIIGEDDTVFIPGFNGRKYDVLVRNKLRAEQRNKLKEVK